MAAIEEACAPAKARNTYASRVLKGKVRCITSHIDDPVVRTRVRQLARSQIKKIVRYKTLAFCDEMTGALNRRGGMFALRTQLNAARRNPGASGAWAECDFDDLKGVNDTLGHLAGDAYILTGVKITQAMARRLQMVVARLGGDEIALLMPSVSADEAEALFRVIADHVNAQRLGPEHNELPVCVSMGSAHFDRSNCSLKGVMDEADQELYRVKKMRKTNGDGPFRGKIVRARLPATTDCVCDGGGI
jgi:diguanylate cyclase (GGDEF)-like protein